MCPFRFIFLTSFLLGDGIVPSKLKVSVFPVSVFRKGPLLSVRNLTGTSCPNNFLGAKILSVTNSLGLSALLNCQMFATVIGIRLSPNAINGETKKVIIVIAVVVIFEFTLGSKINEISSKFNYFSTKEGRKEGVIKIREEMKKAVKKDRYLSQEDAKLLNQFINIIRSVLSETNQ